MGPTLKKQKINNKGKSINKTPQEKKPKVTIEQEEEEEEESNSSESEKEESSELEEQEDSDLEGEIGSDDEVDLADVSSSSEDEEDEEESNFPKLKKKKGTTDDGSESFANALTSIVNSKLKAYDRKDPILVRNKKTLKKLESDKLELKAKKALLQEKKNFHDKFRIKTLLPTDEEEPGKIRELMQHEKDLKKVAQRGVVRLFNAVLSTQIKTNQEISKESIRGQSKKEELMNDVSKEKFLDLIAAAGNED